MAIDLYYSPGSAPCRAVQLTAKLIGIDLNLKRLQISKKEQLTPEFIKINPQHTIPTLVDDGFVIWESYAIITYLVQQYAKDDSLYPNDPKQRSLINQKFFFDMGILYRRFADYYYPILFRNETPNDPEKQAKVEEAVKWLDTFLDGHEFAVGDSLTVADIPLVTTIGTYDMANFDFTPYKNVSRWYIRMKNIVPGYEEINGKAVLTEFINRKR